jgi:diguanylate cyclase (GGDEF)-like protein
MISKMRILLVDDEKNVREVISQILGEQGYEVRESASGSEALELFKTAPFPLVISDLVLDDMSGLDLLPKIKKIRPETEVILLTAYASIETATAALRHGAFDYIIKNYDDLSLLPDVVGRAEKKINHDVEQRKLLDSLIKINTTLKLVRSNFNNVAAFDEHTGLYNRQYFQEFVDGEMSRSAYFKRGFSVVLFAIDIRTGANDPDGGEVTQLRYDVTKSLRRRIRRSDVLARYEENVFAIALPETPRDGARCVIENIHRLIASGSVSSLANLPSGTIQVFAETATFPEDGADSAALIRHALEALWAKKDRL